MSDRSSALDSPNRGLEQGAVRGVPWTLLTFATSKLIGTATTITLARILVPTDFGVVALAMVTIGAAQLVAELGLGGVLVVRQDLDDRARGTVLTLMLIGAGITAAAILALSPAAARLFDEPRLAGVLAALSPSVVLGGFNWFYETTLQGQLEFERRFKGVLAQNVAYSLTGFGAAWAGAGLWSLVVAQVIGTMAYSISLCRLLNDRVRPTFDRDAARATLRAGRPFLAQSGVAFVELNGDNFAVGRVLGTGQLGFYAMAFRLCELPYRAITEPVAKVTFPAFARMRSRGECVTPAFLGVLGLVTLVTFPLGTLLSATANPLVLTVFGDAWRPMIGPLTALGLWGTINHFEATLGYLLNSVGRADLNARASTLAVLPLLVGVVVAAHLGDLSTVAWVMLTHGVASLIARVLLVHFRLEVALSEQWRAVRPAATAAAVTWVTARVTVELFPLAIPAASLACASIVGLATYAGVVSVVQPGALSTTTKRLRRIVSVRSEFSG